MTIPRKPKAYDLEMYFKLNEQTRFIYIKIKECQICLGQTVFATACQVCGRFSATDRGIYFQPARTATLNTVPRDSTLDGLEPKNSAPAPISHIKKTPTGDDNGPEAS